MAFASHGIEDDEVDGVAALRLTRKEAAAYVGVTESGIRDAEKRGLLHALDGQGQSWLEPDELDAWTWRGRSPTPAKKKVVLASAAKARAHEARIRVQQDQKRAAEEERAYEAYYTETIARRDAEDALRRECAERNEAAKRQFVADHLDERSARKALGLEDERSEFRALVRGGLLREVKPPRERVVEGGYGGPAREVEGVTPCVWGGPFYSRTDVLAAREHVIAERRRGAEVVEAARLKLVAERDDGAAALGLLLALALLAGRK